MKLVILTTLLAFFTSVDPATADSSPMEKEILRGLEHIKKYGEYNWTHQILKQKPREQVERKAPDHSRMRRPGEG